MSCHATRRVVLASSLVLFVTTACLSVRGQAAQAPDQKRLAFDVASVKANTSGALGSSTQNTLPDGYTVTNQPLRGIISLVYGVPFFRMSGGPDWMSTDRFDIVAKSSHRITADEKRAMLRTLLEERFKLKTHWETHEGRIFALVMARADREPGPNLVPTTLDCGTILATSQRSESRVPPQRRDVLSPCTASTSPTRFRGSVIQINSFAAWLGMAIRETVVDQTGLSGWFDIDLIVSQESAPKVPPDALTAASATSIGTALQEQLGLKLEPTRGPVDVLVIDHVERPAP
jgi:uncharacterized protein (TIGR03435 family)